jgi:MFS family permease
VLSRWNSAFPDPSQAPLGLAGWQAAFLCAGLPGLLLALWVFSLREPQRGALDGRPQPVARPGAWGEFGRELMTILPPLTLLSASRIEGALKYNLLALAGIAAAAAGLAALTGDVPQWAAYALGAYAIFSWVQSLRHRDLPVHRLIWGTRTTLMLAIAFGSISFMTYAISFWIPPYALRTFYADPLGSARYFGGLTAAEEVASIIGWVGAVAAATGVIAGGVASDIWRRYDPRGRLFVSMVSVVLHAPLTWLMFTTDDATIFYLIFPLAHFFSAAWIGPAIATLQELVLPRMRGTAGATYILGTTMVGLALGPYFAGKMADVLQSLSAGIFALYVVPPFTLLALWLGSRDIEEVEATKEERALAAGEPQ